MKALSDPEAHQGRPDPVQRPHRPDQIAPGFERGNRSEPALMLLEGATFEMSQDQVVVVSKVAAARTPV